MVTDRARLFAIAMQHRKSHTGSRVAYIHVTLVHSKGQSQGHEHFTLNISQKVEDMANITIAIKQEVKYGVSIGIFIFQFDPF